MTEPTDRIAEIYTCLGDGIGERDYQSLLREEREAVACVLDLLAARRW